MTSKDFLEYNDVVYAPTKEGEDPRPAVSFELIYIFFFDAAMNYNVAELYS